MFLMRFYQSQAEEVAFYMVFICLFITAHLTIEIRCCCQKSKLEISRQEAGRREHNKISGLTKIPRYGKTETYVDETHKL